MCGSMPFVHCPRNSARSSPAARDGVDAGKPDRDEARVPQPLVRVQRCRRAGPGRRGGSGRGPPARGVRAPQYRSDGLSSLARATPSRTLGDCNVATARDAITARRGSSTMHEMAAERLISADSHVAINQAQVKQHLAPKFHDEYDAAIVEFGRRMSESGAARMNAAALDKRPHPVRRAPGLFRPARAPRRHGRRRCRGRGAVLRGERVPVPLPVPRRLARGDTRVQRRDARVRRGRPEAPHRQRADPDPRHRRRVRRGRARRRRSA